MSKAHTMGAAEARALLALAGPASAQAVTAAFRVAVKAARPDAPGGCPDRFRRVIEAYHVLRRLDGPTAALPAPKAMAAPLPFAISLDEALRGVGRTLRLPGRKPLGVRLPAGLRAGEKIRLKGCGEDGADLYLLVSIAPDTARRLDGDHLHVEVEIDPSVLEHGGRVEVETTRGPRSVWITRGFAGDALRVRGEGLPARDRHPAGDLFVRLKVRPAEGPRASQRALEAFASAWAGGSGFVRARGIG